MEHIASAKKNPKLRQGRETASKTGLAPQVPDKTRIAVLSLPLQRKHQPTIGTPAVAASSANQRVPLNELTEPSMSPQIKKKRTVALTPERK